METRNRIANVRSFSLEQSIIFVGTVDVVRDPFRATNPLIRSFVQPTSIRKRRYLSGHVNIRRIANNHRARRRVTT